MIPKTTMDDVDVPLPVACCCEPRCVVASLPLAVQERPLFFGLMRLLVLSEVTIRGGDMVASLDVASEPLSTQVPLTLVMLVLTHAT